MRGWDAGTVIFATLAGLSLAACVCVQILLFSGAIPKTALMIESIEGLPAWMWDAARGDALADGEPYEPTGASAQAGGILLKLSACDDAVGGKCCMPALFVLVNGVPVADFRYGTAAVVVHRGDLLEAEIEGEVEDGTESALDESWERQMEIEVEEVSPNVKEPRKGDIFLVDPGRTNMGNAMIL